MTMLSCVAIVERRSEAFDCDIVPVRNRNEVRVKITDLSQEAESKAVQRGEKTNDMVVKPKVN